MIKNAESLQKIHKVTTVVFDKTGTITKGEPTLVDYIGEDRSGDLQILASLEKLSEHPLADAIVKKAEQEKLSFLSVSSFEIIEGKGLQGTIDKKQWYAGNLKLLEDKGISYDKEFIAQLTSEGKTPIFLADDKSIKAIFGVADTIKENAKDSLAELHRLGIRSVMLTGDNKQTAEYIA